MNKVSWFFAQAFRPEHPRITQQRCHVNQLLPSSEKPSSSSSVSVCSNVYIFFSPFQASLWSVLGSSTAWLDCLWNDESGPYVRADLFCCLLDLGSSGHLAQFFAKLDCTFWHRSITQDQLCRLTGPSHLVSFCLWGKNPELKISRWINHFFWILEVRNNSLFVMMIGGPWQIISHQRRCDNYRWLQF